MQLTPGEDAVPERSTEVDVVTSQKHLLSVQHREASDYSRGSLLTKSRSFFSSVPYIFKDMFPLTDFIWSLKFEKLIFDIAVTVGGF